MKMSAYLCSVNARRPHSDILWCYIIHQLNCGAIGADSTGATGASAPVLIKEPGQRSPFAPVIFRESIMEVSILPQVVMTT